MTDDTPGARRLALPPEPSLARVLHQYGQRWEIEKTERSTQWIAVLRHTGGDYIRIVSGHDLSSLQHKMDRTENEQEHPA